MTEIDELIEAAKKVLKAWKKPSNETPERHSLKSWQRIIDERIYRGPG